MRAQIPENLQTSYAPYPRRYVNLDEELRKVYIGQFRKKQRKAGDAPGLCGLPSGAAGSKTLDRNHFSRIRVSVMPA